MKTFMVWHVHQQSVDVIQHCLTKSILVGWMMNDYYLFFRGCSNPKKIEQLHGSYFIFHTGTLFFFLMLACQRLVLSGALQGLHADSLRSLHHAGWDHHLDCALAGSEMVLEEVPNCPRNVWAIQNDPLLTVDVPLKVVIFIDIP